MSTQNEDKDRFDDAETDELAEHVALEALAEMREENTICVWPDGMWCYKQDLVEYAHMSDDYQQMNWYDYEPARNEILGGLEDEH